MESNKDEAIRCLAIAQKHRDAGNIPSAKKFCQKSINLFSTPEASKLLDSINSAESASDFSSTTSSANGAASGTETHPSAAGAKHRHTASAPGNGTAGGSGEKRDFTPEQHAVVKRVRACKVTEYYEILSVKRGCEEVEIKKAYKKLALALHPDKNGAPNADEAFKMVSKAFQVLSDPQKRAAYDRHGSDPEDRYAGMRSPGFGMGRNGTASPFGDEMSAEELFNMFFGGGGMGGGMFEQAGFNGPVFTASFGPNGFRTTHIRTERRGGGRGGNANTNGNAGSPRSVLVQLLPLILLFALSLLSALPNLFATPPIPDPNFSFVPTSVYNTERVTSGMKIKYHVNDREFTQHPLIRADLAAAQSGSNTRGRSALNKFEGSVERVYTNELYGRCRQGLEFRERRKEREIGFLGIGTDWDKVSKIDAEKVNECEELRGLGYDVRV